MRREQIGNGFQPHIVSSDVIAAEQLTAVSTYRETLPTNCPPTDATPPNQQIVYRLTLSDPPTQSDFDSNAARGRSMRPNGNACDHASCSMVIACDKGRQRLIDMSNLPFYKEKRTYIAHISIHDKSGTIKINTRSAHVDLWMFSDFDPVAATIKSEEIE